MFPAFRDITDSCYRHCRRTVSNNGIHSCILMQGKIPEKGVPGFARLCFSSSEDQLDAGGVPDGGVPDGFSPDCRSPEGAVPLPGMPPGPPCGAVPFIAIPSGGVPEGAVPLAGISAGGVPAGATFSEVPTDTCAEAAGVCSAGLDAALLPESDVQPATRIPAMRNTDATSMMMVLLFMRYVSLVFREGSF